uniref:BED-type domain-containing protein n=1 Tax=Meloidogyne hapla TaxID=6305 RepID=A0A1I8B2G2_MELHA
MLIDNKWLFNNNPDQLNYNFHQNLGGETDTEMIDSNPQQYHHGESSATKADSPHFRKSQIGEAFTKIEVDGFLKWNCLNCKKNYKYGNISNLWKHLKKCNLDKYNELQEARKHSHSEASTSNADFTSFPRSNIVKAFKKIEGVWNCNYCNYSYKGTNTFSFWRHLEVYHPEKYAELHKDKEKSIVWNSFTISPSDKERAICKLCGNVYKAKSYDLQRHLNFHNKFD